MLESLPGTGLDSEPSPAMQEFLAAIETADPNAPDMGEDDTNASWGHQQFRSGALRFDNLTWSDVGNRDVTY